MYSIVIHCICIHNFHQFLQVRDSVELLRKSTGKVGINIATDCRYDIPGFSAMYGTVSVMELETNYIIAAKCKYLLQENFSIPVGENLYIFSVVEKR